MGKLIKILITIVAILVLLLLVAVIVVPLVVDPNDFKPQIQTLVKDKTGRDLALQGDLELSLFPWIGVSTGSLSLSNAEGFGDQPFAAVASTDVKVKLLPLLSKKVEISRIVLKGLNLNLAKNSQGISNWNDLLPAENKSATEKPAAQSETESGSALAALAIGGITIESANIDWNDQQSGQHAQIKDFNLETDRLTFGEPTGVKLTMTLMNQAPQLTEYLDFKTDIIVNQALDKIKLSRLQLNSTTSGKDIPGDNLKAALTADIAADLARQVLNIDNLVLNSGDMSLTANLKGTAIKTQPVFSGAIGVAEFNLAKLLKQMRISLPEMSDQNALSKVALHFDVEAGSESASLKNLSMVLDDSTMKGTVDIRKYSSPIIAVNLNLDAIDADRYLPAEKQDDKTAKTGAASPAAAAAAGAALIPVDSLRKLNADAVLTVNKLKIKKLQMQDMRLKLHASNGIVTTEQAVKQFYQGGYTGSATINVTGQQPTITLNEKLSSVQIEPLLTDYLGKESIMTGTVNANADLQTRGNSTHALKSSLGGRADFRFTDGVVKGFNLQKIIDNSKALIEGKPLPTENKNDQTIFSEISGTANITGGLVNNEDLKAVSSRIVVDGSGSANLVTEQLDYKIVGKAIEKAKADQAEKIKGVPLIVKIQGNLAKPSYTLDIPAMLLAKNKDKIDQKKEQVLKKLDNKIGPGASDLIKGFLK